MWGVKAGSLGFPSGFITFPCVTLFKIVSLNFFICKMRMMVPTYGVVGRAECM